MKFCLKSKHVWFFAFTGVFSLLMAFVFWGTWALDFVPVMPDCPTVLPPEWFSEWRREWLVSGKFIPGDLIVFLGSPYFWVELQYAAAAYFAALGCAYFMRGRGLSRLAAYGAGLLLAFSGYWLTLFSAGHLGWFRWMTYGIFPFGLIDRALAPGKGKLRHWLLLGATVAWGCYYQPDLWLLFTGFTGVYFLYRTFAAAREIRLASADAAFFWRRWAFGCALAAVSLVMIGGAGFRSAIVNDFAGRQKMIEQEASVSPSESEDSGLARWIFVTNWSLPPEESLEFFIPRINGDTSCLLTLSIGAQRRNGIRPYKGALGRPYEAKTGNYRQHSLYVGWITCILALVGAISGFLGLRNGSGRPDRTPVFFFAAAVVFWLLSMGRYCEPAYRIVFSLPFGDSLRAPVKWHHLTEFCLAVLAGFGIDAILRSFVGKWRHLPIALGALVVFGAVDLARVDHLYCAPVDIGEARRQKCSFSMNLLPRASFANPQVAAMVKARRIVPLARPQADLYLVGMLQPWGKPNGEPFPPMGAAAWLGVLSMVASLAVGVYAIRKS